MSYEVHLNTKESVRNLRYYHDVILNAYPESGFDGLIRDDLQYKAIFNLDPSSISEAVVDLWDNSTEPDPVELVPVIEGE